MRFSTGAKVDLLEAMQFIDQQGERRGKEFRDELRGCIQDIKIHPTAWPRVSKRVRVRIMKAFKYGIYYEYLKETDEIRVGAIMHLARRPVRWKKRFKN